MVAGIRLWAEYQTSLQHMVAAGSHQREKPTNLTLTLGGRGHSPTMSAIKPYSDIWWWRVFACEENNKLHFNILCQRAVTCQKSQQTSLWHSVVEVSHPQCRLSDANYYNYHFFPDFYVPFLSTFQSCFSVSSFTSQQSSVLQPLINCQSYF